ncbi:MAG: hypothetical protein ACXWC9_07860 [Pseudobdellovibrionaceae bacterium]
MRSSSSPLLIFLPLFLGMVLSPLSSFAASVTQVKGNKLLIQLDGLQVAQGSELYVLNPEGKKIGLVQIRQVKGDKALGEITKGRAVVGAPMSVKGAPATATDAASAGSDVTGKSKMGKHVGGVLAGYSMNSMSLTIQHGTSTKEDATLKDSGFSLKGFYDYSISPAFTIRLASGLEMFSAKGTIQLDLCENGTSKNCEVSFNYLAMEGSAHYNITEGSTKIWVGLGYSFLFAVSKKNNIPNLSSDSSTNQMILVSAGGDFWTSKTSFFPVVVEYGMFPGSSNVKADGIFLRGGYGFTF